MKYIELSIPGNIHSIISAEGECCERILCCLANILRLELQEGNVKDNSIVFISDREPEPIFSMHPWEGKINQLVHIYWIPDELRYYFKLDFQHCNKELARIVMRRALALALLHQVHKGRCILCHGALLTYPKEQKSIVLIGRSGMGKTTASLRFERQGGEALSDDKFLLTYKNNDFFAQPLPTWSRFLTSPDISVSFSKYVKLHALIILSRGEGDRLVPLDSDQWTLDMLNSFNLPIAVPQGWLPVDQMCSYMEKSMDYLPILQKKFGRYKLQGDLNGAIFEHLLNFLQNKQLT